MNLSKINKEIIYIDMDRPSKRKSKKSDPIKFEKIDWGFCDGNYHMSYFLYGKYGESKK